ncbi:DUF2156 domain-containing protein [Clostridium akagii]|uniref:DUF2156 domain-containing protein n=1 Tax=Clostridium akagii TaxID=91623 RepID=UPI00047C17C4|nr:DUF2156 domain-containing protein [Clostridium akagii]
MLKFKRIDLNDKKLLDAYLNDFEYKSCEYSFTTLYIWKDACEIEYAIYDNVLIIKKKDFDGETHFMQPVGYKIEQLREIVEMLKECKIQLEMQCLFKDIEENFVEDLKKTYGEDIEIVEDRDNFDYIYDSEKLISLSGKKLHAKKNHYNQFIKNYSYVIKDIREVSIEECIKALNYWLEQKEDKSEYLCYEIKGVESLLRNIDKFNFQGMVVFVEDKIVALTIGEKISDETAVIHIEKADPEIKGLYTFINKIFVETCFSSIPKINREQDLGIPGLRKAKESYKLFEFVKKYVVE